MHRVLIVGKVLDEHRNIDIRNAAAVLGAYFDGGFISDHVFPSVAGDMVIDAFLERPEKSGFPVIPAAYDQGNAFADSHAAHRSRMRECERDCQLPRTPERNGALHRVRRDPALPGQNRPVRNEPTEPLLMQCLTDELLIITEMDRCPKLILIDAAVHKRRCDSTRQKIVQNTDECPRIDGTPVCGKTDLESKCYITAFRIDAAGRTLQYFLRGSGDSD